MIESKRYVEELSDQNKEFAIVALTGRVRAGTSDVCKLLTSGSFADNATQPADTRGYSMSEVREHKVIYRYLHHNWCPFIEISVTSIIISFWLENKERELLLPTQNADEKIALPELIRQCIDQEQFADKVLEGIVSTDTNIRLQKGWGDTEKLDLNECRSYIEGVIEKADLNKEWEKISACLSHKEYPLQVFVFCYGILPVLGGAIEEVLGKNVHYTTIFQTFGNNIRAYGKIYPGKNDKVNAANLFCIPERINRFVKILRHHRAVYGSEGMGKHNPIQIVINNLKNIFEAFYFRRRYSAFYLLAVSCDEKKRQARFENINKYRLTDLNENLASGKNIFKNTVKYLEKSSDSRTGQKDYRTLFGKKQKDIKKDLGLNDAEFEFVKGVILEDSLRMECYRNNVASFILQDVTTCIENSDIFVKRDLKEKDCSCDYPLVRSLARIVTLILKPGILTPTKVEKCMQIAMTAKLNSGCLSRQVGAVVTDSEYNILSLGWNDAPCGLESCIRRNLFDLIRKHDPWAYSEYELYDEEFRAYLDSLKIRINEERKSELAGLPFAFCFKDIYQDIIVQRDQIYTRALHGEERALAICGNERAKGGYLFTTSSPCELCAKKAKEAQIRKIYYIEQYKGISQTHIINAGSVPERAEYEAFVGAVGLAYVKLYTPVMPYKDELAALGYSPADIKKEMHRVADQDNQEEVIDAAEAQVQQYPRQ